MLYFNGYVAEIMGQTNIKCNTINKYKARISYKEGIIKRVVKWLEGWSVHKRAKGRWKVSQTNGYGWTESLDVTNDSLTKS